MLQVIEQLQTIEEGDLQTLEQRVLTVCLALGRTVMEHTLNQMGEQAERPARRDGECGHRQRLVAVEHLVQDGLIEKVPSQTDHRMVRLSLTALGEQRVRDLNGTLGSLSEHVMERIPMSEHEGIQRSLTLLLAALQAEVAHPSLGGLTGRAVEGAERCDCD